jgi:predicted RNase H-like HicB family nuclease
VNFPAPGAPTANRRPSESGTSFAVGLEEGAAGATLVHALDLPGCVAGGESQQDALTAFQSVLSQWLVTLGTLGHALPPADAELEIRVDEWHVSDAAVAEGQSSVLFDADRAELDEDGIARQLQRLGDLRGYLLARLRPLPDGVLDGIWRGEWTARVALEELARSHWWTLSRLGSSSMAQVPDRTLARLDTAMALVVQRFTELEPDARSRVVEIEGELWTPRKVLRRLLWLEWTFGRLALAALSGERKS